LSFCPCESLREAIGERLHLQHLDELGRARCALFPAQAMQLTEIGDVLSRREIAVDAGAVGQHTDRAARGEGIGPHALAVDERIAGVRLQHRVQHAQRGGFAGAIRA